MVQFNYTDKREDHQGGPTMADDVRQQRMARYKEERRRQLAAQFGRREAALSDAPETGLIRSTRASRLRSAVSTGLDANVGRCAPRRETGGTRQNASPGTPTSLMSSSSDSKEKSPGGAASPGMTHSSPRRERDKSSKRKSNLNRQLNAEQVVHDDSPLPDDGVRRRLSQTRMVATNALTTTVSSKSVGSNSRPASTHIPSSAVRHGSSLPESPKRATRTPLIAHLSQRRKISDQRSDCSDRSTQDSESTPRVTSAPVSRIPKKVSSSPSLFSSSSRESSPRHKSSTIRLTLASHSPPQANSEPPLSPVSITNCQQVNGGVNHTESPQPVESVVTIETVNNERSVPASTPQQASPLPHHHPPRTAMPVSILKRKTSQDEGGGSGSAVGASAPPPPVTFSPSVVDPVPGRRQGILKKHRSLDEAEVMRRRSCSPDVETAEFRPILKHQRRSSLEELHRRTQSPEPQSILKRKTSREEGVENAANSEPQGILKRKTSVSNPETSSGHITIAESVIFAITGGVPTPATDEHVKPILKKKSLSSEEAPSESVSHSDAPRPILKKKSSVETDDGEEKHPKKPILKFRKDSTGSAFARVPRLISDNSDESVHVVINSPEREVDSGGVVPILKRPDSDSASSNGTDSGSSRHKSVVWRNYSKQSPDAGLNNASQRHKRRSLDVVPFKEENRWPCRPGSVAERVMNMESFLASEGCSEISPKTSPSSSSTGAFPKRLRDRDRFSTQPITAQEISDSRSRVPNDVGLYVGSEGEGQSEPRTTSLQVEESLIKSEILATTETSQLMVEEASSLTTVTATAPINFADLMADQQSENNSSGLVRSDSVSARASLFAQLEAQMKQAADETKARKFTKGSGSRRLKADGLARFSTQPVTLDEVEEAKRQNETNNEAQEEGDEADPSKLSLAERVSLFNKKMVNERLSQPQQPLVRSRSARFKTQPVTTEEVSTAKGIVSAPQLSKSASGILVSGILKNLAEKTGIKPSPKSKPGDNEGSEEGSEESEEEVSSKATRSILKPPPNPFRVWSNDSDSSSNLRGVLKKESSEEAQHSGDLHSILKSSSATRNSSSDESSESDSEGKKVNKNLDLVNLLHKVEAEARVQHEEELVRSRNSSDRLMNLRNLAADQSRQRTRRRRDAGDTSEGDTSSSGGREVRKIINNEAVARRRQAAIAKQAAERVKGTSAQSLSKSKSQSSVSSAKEDEPRMVLNGGTGETVVSGGLRRCLTQPMPEPPCDTVDEPTMTIAQRLAALQKSGQSDWRKRISRLGADEDLPSININDAQEVLRQQLSSPPSETRPADIPPLSGNILSERLDRLQTATHGWKKRVEPSDAVQFSVAGRMALSPAAESSPLTSPAIERKKKAPRPARFKSKNQKEVQSTPTSPEAELNLSSSVRFKRSVSAPSGEDEDSSLSPVEGDENVFLPRVTIPKEFDEDFSSFFPSVHLTSDGINIKDDDLEQIKSDSRQMLVQAKRVRVQRRHEASRNPLKVLAARTDLCTDYIEIRSNVAQKELRRLNVEKLSKNSSLAVEALAGLASKEDFTAVSLRKANSQAVHSSVSAMLPYKDLMLLHVKGRRHVQTRLVRPHYSSVNQGDSYVLVTPNEVFHWMGEFSNVIERSRGSEIAQHILQTKDLGCNATQIVTLSGTNKGSKNHARFWTLLGAHDDLAATFNGIGSGHPDEDEVFEMAIIDTNMIYSVEGDELVPEQKVWGSIPRIEILNPAKILVFDFGTELYVWMGKNATMEQRRSAVQLVEELWSQGYDYSECDVCPMSAAQSLGSRNNDENSEVEKKKGERPSWGLLAKVTQHMETILFREKFLDWPDFSRVIRTKRKASQEIAGERVMELKPCDAEDLLNWRPPPSDLQLEGSHLGRGRMYFDEETRRHFEVTTQNIKVWHIEEFTTSEVPEDRRGQFYSDDSYVIRWLYGITVTGRELSGQPSKHATMGRDRCVYFIWQGSGATLNDQGAAALLTVQLDSERGPQIRIPQNGEPPAFLSLFEGSAVIHLGKRGQKRTQDDWRLYVCRGEETQEAVLVEVSCSIRSLRSRASFLLINMTSGQLYLWHGSKVLSHTRKVAVHAVDQLTEGDMAEFGLGHLEEVGFKEIDEGSEPKEFFQGIGGSNRHMYVSLANYRLDYNWTPKLFHLSSILGKFKATPVVPPCSHSELTCPFPYVQNDLYSARQPALFLLDAEEVVWLWQGWIPSEESGSDPDDQEEQQLNSLGMAVGGCVSVRWQAERRAAMATALELWRLKHGETVTPRVLLAYAGLEPLKFTNLFPYWTDRDDIAEINISDGRKPGESLSVEAELARLTRSTYPPAQLLQRPLPEGVDPTRLEIYLSPHDFQELLGLSKEQYAELPTWKQTNLKKSAGLF